MLATPLAGDLEDAVSDGDLEVGGLDPGQLGDDRDAGRIVRPVDVHERTEAMPPPDQARNLAEVREQLLHLVLELVQVLAIPHFRSHGSHRRWLGRAASFD